MPKRSLSPDRYSTQRRLIPIAVQNEAVQNIPLTELFPFKNHPFRIVDDEAMQRTVESVSQFGVLSPAIARPRVDGGYEIISGHRRLHASQLLGLETMPVIVRQMDDDTAVITMVDSNLQRETMLPSERAKAYKMKMDAMAHRAGRPPLENSGQLGRNFAGKESREIIAEQTGESARQVQRYVNLTNLIPELMQMVDEKKIAFSPAVELSFLTSEEQTNLLDAMEYGQSTPSLSQAQRLKKLSQDGGCDRMAMYAMMSEEKKGDLEKVTIDSGDLRKFFPKSYTPKQMHDVIIKLLTQWQKRRQQDLSR